MAWQPGIPQSIGAMDEGGILMGTYEGPAGSAMDGNVRGSKPIQYGQRVRRRSLDIDVPGQCRDGNKFDVW